VTVLSKVNSLVSQNTTLIPNECNYCIVSSASSFRLFRQTEHSDAASVCSWYLKKAGHKDKHFINLSFSLNAHINPGLLVVQHSVKMWTQVYLTVTVKR
jgi:hypothetical protein